MPSQIHLWTIFVSYNIAPEFFSIQQKGTNINKDKDKYKDKDVPIKTNHTNVSETQTAVYSIIHFPIVTINIEAFEACEIIENYFTDSDTDKNTDKNICISRDICKGPNDSNTNANANAKDGSLQYPNDMFDDELQLPSQEIFYRIK
jgi:hypothetical protein